MNAVHFNTVELRPYQDYAIREVRKTLADGIKRVMVYSPTGSGKGELAVAIAQMAKAKGRKVLFLVHRKDLVRQQAERFGKYSMDVGILQGDNTFRPHSDITVGSIQTLASRQKFGWHFDFDVVIVDEAHLCAGSKQYHTLFKSWNNLPIVGFSATPFSRGLGKKYDWGKVFEDMVIVSTIADLINDGFLVDCEIYAPSEPDLSGVKIVAGDYHERQLGEAVDQPKLIGDIVTHWHRLAKDQQTICFATNIAHSKHIVKQFFDSGVSAMHVDCYMPEEDRLEAITKFRGGDIQVLSNVALFAEGFDAPETSCMILARPTKSLIRYIQMIGRVLRPSKGKDKALILDHSGSVRRLGFPTDDLPLALDDGKPKKASGTRENEKLPKVCTSCGYVDAKRSHTCPSCGFAPERSGEIETESGTLQKITRKFNADDKQRIYSALVGFLELQRSRGRQWKDGWVSQKYKSIVGVWPKGLSWESGPMTQEVSNWLQHERISFANKKPAACPKCGSKDFEKQPGAGPHHAGAKCKSCLTFWWLRRGD